MFSIYIFLFCLGRWYFGKKKIENKSNVCYILDEMIFIIMLKLCLKSSGRIYSKRKF